MSSDLDLLMVRLSFFSSCLMWLMAALYLADVSLCSTSLCVLLCSASITWNSQSEQSRENELHGLQLKN